MSRVLVIGGTGFVGRHVCAALETVGREVVVAARTSSLRVDLATVAPAELARLLDEVRPAAVVNLTGSIWGRTDAQMWESAAEPTLRLLAALSRLEHRPRLVHLGSVLESDGSAYGRAKRVATDAVLSSGLNAMVLRVANVAGPGAPPVSLLGRVATQLATGATVVTVAPLRAYRDFIDVRDVADAVVAAVDATVTGVAVDIGRGEAVPVRRVVELLIEVSGVHARIEEVGTAGTADRVQADVGSAAELLGWQPRRSLETSLLDFWREIRIAPLEPITSA